MQNLRKHQTGFTFVELLIVITLLAALSIATFAAINPVKRLADARDTHRRTDADSFLTAVFLYFDDNKGAFPAGIAPGMADTQIGTAASGCNFTNTFCTVSATACVDLTATLAKYLSKIPQDPTSGTTSKTMYTISMDSNRVVTVKACGTEGTTLIQESR